MEREIPSERPSEANQMWSECGICSSMYSKTHRCGNGTLRQVQQYCGRRPEWPNFEPLEMECDGWEKIKAHSVLRFVAAYKSKDIVPPLYMSVWPSHLGHAVQFWAQWGRTNKSRRHLASFSYQTHLEDASFSHEDIGLRSWPHHL